MSIFVSLYAGILFFILTPSILLRIPSNGSKYTVALVHAVIFGIIFYLTHKHIWRLVSSFEGFQEGATSTSCEINIKKVRYERDDYKKKLDTVRKERDNIKKTLNTCQKNFNDYKIKHP